MATAVVAYNVFIAPDGETISEGVDELLATHPLLTRAAIALLTLHVANLIAAQVDPLHLAFRMARRQDTSKKYAGTDMGLWWSFQHA